MTKQQRKRKKQVVNPRVQWTLALRVVLHFFVFICAGAIFGLINQFLLDPFGGLWNNLDAFARNSSPVLIALICLIPIFIRDTLTLTNRIAGPIYNMQNTMKRLTDGEDDVPQLRFRKQDMWEGLSDDFNSMVDTLREANGTTPQKEESASQRTQESELQPA